MSKQHENDPRMTSPGDIHQISAEIGGLKKAVEFMTALWERQEETASAGRRALHDKFESFRTDVGLQIAGLSLRVDRIVDTMEKIKPAVQKYEDEKLREEGAKRLGVRLWAAMVAAAGLIGWGLHEVISWVKHP